MYLKKFCFILLHPERKICVIFCVSKGFNTGVVLFHLERMRQSAEYNGYLEAEEVARVMNKYGYHVSLGDQDWFTNIGFEVSGL